MLPLGCVGRKCCALSGQRIRAVFQLLGGLACPRLQSVELPFVGWIYSDAALGVNRSSAARQRINSTFHFASFPKFANVVG